MADTASNSALSATAAALEDAPLVLEIGGKKIAITPYSSHDDSIMDSVMQLMAKDLSEPYSIFTYRYFMMGWPQYCLLAHVDNVLVGAILCKTQLKNNRTRGYVAMFAVDAAYRKLGIGRELAAAALARMAGTCDEIVLETEVTNSAALRLYEGLGFIRGKRLPKYYLNGNDAYRLYCWMT